MIKNLQKIVGIAALGHTAALMVGMVLSFTLMFPILDATPDQAQKFLQAAVVFGFLWAGLTIGTSSLNLHNFGVVANISGSVAAQAAAWTALERSLWVLLLSLAALRTGELTRATGYLGVFLGVVGSLTMVPALAKAMFLIFGPGMMAWSAWVGIAMLRRSTTLDAGKSTRTRENWQIRQISNR